MAELVVTIVGDDRAGLVGALAERIAAHGGNWQRSELTELAGAFAGIVLVSVPDDAAEDLRRSLDTLEGLLTITTHAGTAVPPPTSRSLTFTVLGNDRPGIVREVTSAISEHALSIDAFASDTRPAPMSGGMLFEATVTVRIPEGTDASKITDALERVAAEIQVDLTVASGAAPGVAPTDAAQTSDARR